MKMMIPRYIGLPNARYEGYEVEGAEGRYEAWMEIREMMLHRADTGNRVESVHLLRDVYLNELEGENPTAQELDMIMDQEVVEWIADFWQWLSIEWGGSTPLITEIGIEGFLYDYILDDSLFVEVNGPIYDPKRHDRDSIEYNLQKRLDRIRKRYAGVVESDSKKRYFRRKR